MNEQWLYAVDGVQYGPVSRADLQQFLADGRLRATDAVWTSGMAQWIEARYVRTLSDALPVAPAAAAPFFPVGELKLVLMMIGTFGLYELYWFYKQWATIRKRTGEEMWPVARAIFPVFFFHLLVKDVNEAGRTQGFEPLSVSAWTTLFVIFTITWRLPNPLDWLAFLALIPVFIVQQRINEIHVKAAPLVDPNRRIRAWNWLAIILGIPFFMFTVWVTFAEPAI